MKSSHLIITKICKIHVAHITPYKPISIVPDLTLSISSILNIYICTTITYEYMYSHSFSEGILFLIVCYKNKKICNKNRYLSNIRPPDNCFISKDRFNILVI